MNPKDKIHSSWLPSAGFLGCNHFNQVNEILKNTKKELIKF